MEIDLSKVIGYSKNSLQSRALMRSIMLDLYPGKTREMNILLNVYESGVPRIIKNEGTITDAKYAHYIHKIVDDYGMQEQWAVVGLNAWVDICLGKGKAASIKYKVGALSNCMGIVPTGNASGGGYTNPIVHNGLSPSTCLPIKGNNNDYEIKDLGNGTAVLLKFKGFDVKDIIVPTEIKSLRVIGVGEDAYEQCLGIERLIIPEGIEYILNGAFSGCSNLTEVTFPTTLRRLGETTDRYGKGAFSYTKIRKVNLPNDISSIGSCTFRCCRELESIELPDNLRIIGQGAFEGCSKLQSLSLSEGLQRIEKDALKNCKGLKELTIPSTVTYFGSDALATDGYRSSIKVHCYPGSRAIEYCRANRIKIEPIGNVVFDNGFSSANIKSIVHVHNVPHVSNIKSGVDSDYDIKELGNGTAVLLKFKGFDVEDTIVPTEIKGLRVIGVGKNAYKQCLGIKRLIIPEGIEYILDGAFTGCSNLTEVAFPTTLRRLGETTGRYGEGAFSFTKIRKVNLPNDISSIGFCTFQYCSELESIELPDNLRIVGEGAFKGCSKLQSLSLPEGLQRIEKDALKNCNGLKELTIPSTVTYFGSDALATNGYRSSIKVHCYPGSRAIEYCRANRIVFDNVTR